LWPVLYPSNQIAADVISYLRARCRLGALLRRDTDQVFTRRQAVTMQISDEHLRGRTVIAADGQVIGEVTALSIDSSTWTIVSLQIKLSKSVAEQIGASRGLLRAAALELPVRLVQSVADAVLLSVPTLELRQVVPEEKS